MLPLAAIAKIALRYDTAMSRAMLRALGVPLPHVVHADVPTPVEHVDEDVMWCFANHGSPMDLMR